MIPAAGSSGGDSVVAVGSSGGDVVVVVNISGGSVVVAFDWDQHQSMPVVFGGVAGEAVAVVVGVLSKKAWQVAWRRR